MVARHLSPHASPAAINEQLKITACEQREFFLNELAESQKPVALRGVIPMDVAPESGRQLGGGERQGSEDNGYGARPHAPTVTRRGALQSTDTEKGPVRKPGLSCSSVVRDTGIEPVTSSVSGKRSPAELIARVETLSWRWRRESNPCARLCRPLPHHSATPPLGLMPQIAPSSG